MSGPLPLTEIAPLVLDELKAAGLADDNILFLAALGTHRALPSDEVVRKLGKDIEQRYAWINHNCWENLKEIGETSRKNRIKINQNYAAADCGSPSTIQGPPEGRLWRRRQVPLARRGIYRYSQVQP